jgi:hypothetical protein
MAIPGVTTTIRDRFYSVSRSDIPTGPKVVAIARRSTADGTGSIADVDVVRATNEADVITAFGDGSDIHRAYVELVTAGAERIYLVPLPSNTVFNHTTGTLTSSSFDGNLFDSAFDAAESVVPDVVMPWGRGGHPDDWEDPATPGNDAEYGFHADNSSSISANWAFQVGNKVKQISLNTNPCLAVMGVKPYMSTAEKMTPGNVTSHLDALTSGTNTPDLSSTNLIGDTGESMSSVGPYVIVVAAEVKPVNYSSDDVDFGYSNGAANVVAALTGTPSYQSIVTSPIYNIESMRYSPARAKKVDLSNASINSLIINFNRVPAMGDAITFTSVNSDYIRITSKRIIDDATKVIRQVCQKFIGQPSNMQVRNSMETAISSGLRGMQTLGAILAHDFSVTYVPTQNKAVVDLVLTPAFELKNIEIQVAINL